MNFLVDAQLPPALAEWLRDRGYDAAALREVGLRDESDLTIWNWAAARRAIIVTKDEDFPLLAEARPGGPQILWIRTGNLVNRMLLRSFEVAWPEVVAALESGISVVELR